MTVSNAAYHYTLSDAARALLPRHAAWWQHRGSLYVAHETGPLQSLWLPLSDGTLAHEDLDLTPDMLDLERITGAALDAGLLDVDGDTLQYRVPYGVVPWVEAIMGCPIRATFQSGSMRSGHIVRYWDDWKHAAKWVDAWADALVALTRMLVERSGGCYAIAQTLMRGPSDLAEAALGPEFMCTSMYDHPDELRAFLRDICDVFMHVLRIQMEHWPRVEGGYVSWWGIWAPGTVVRTQCDASAFLSPRQYAEWFLPCDVRLCEAVDYGIIHLHSGSLHTVDALLQVDKPQVIQVSLDPEPSGPPYVSLLPAFEKILLGGKSLIIDGAITAEEVRLS
ncbi:MAG: hypothetical protein GX557_15170, partial [Chloroflexi bacterium]|nr:hypothetical protein [Chloroflexota bacterium]